MQLEFGFLLGPPDGRYLVRPTADALVESVLVLSTLGAPQRSRSGGPQRSRSGPQRARLGAPRARTITSADPEPVPTSRATVARAAPFASRADAEAWLAAADLDAERAAAIAVLNRALRAHRAATADPYVAEVSAERALVVRIGHGSGDEVADGRYGEALELPRSGPRRPRRSMEAPEERFAALLGGREEIHPAEELVLRARADLNAGRTAEAALQSRVAIEALLASSGADELASHREAVAAAANAALSGAVPGQHAAALEEAVTAMERALKRRRLGA